jgi:hypothetical protein
MVVAKRAVRERGMLRTKKGDLSHPEDAIRVYGVSIFGTYCEHAGSMHG